jgi:hypothetical protein
MLELGYFGKLAVENAKGKMENIGCEVVANALCGLLLWMMIAVEPGLNLAPTFF